MELDNETTREAEEFLFSGMKDDEGVEEEDVETSTEFSYDEESTNLVPEFMANPEGETALGDIAENVMSEYTSEWEAQEGYRDQWARDLELFYMKLRPKNAPFQDCANIGLPMMAENLTRLVMKASSELFGDWSKVMAFSAKGYQDQEEADVLTLHTNYQLREELRDFPRQMQRGLLMYFMGRVACHSYYDEVRHMIRHEMLSPEEFLIPYQRVTTMPDLSDSPWVIRRRFYARHELEQLRGTFEFVDDVLKAGSSNWDSEALESATHTMLNDMNHVETPEGGAQTPYLILQYEGWLTLPKQDRQRYVQLFIDETSHKVLSMRIHEEPTWEERSRYERQRAEISAYRADYKERQQRDLMKSAMATAGEFGGEVQSEQDSLELPAIAPDWMKDPDDMAEEPAPMRKDPVHMFSYTVCIESLEGSEGMGYGRPQAEMNLAANTLLSQFIDSATLSNIPCYIASPDTTFEDHEPLVISPGKVNKLADTGPADVRNALVKVEIPPANPQMVQLVKMLDEKASSSAQSPDILSGGEVKSGEPYRSTAARMEQASQQLSAVTMKFAQFLKQILRNHVTLNSYFLPDEVIFSVPSFRDGEPLKVSRKMYQDKRILLITADMRYASMAQRVSEADEMVTMATRIPLLQQRPAFMWEALRKSLIARGRYDMIPLLGPQPPIVAAPPQPAGGMRPPGAPQGGPPRPGQGKAPPPPGITGNLASVTAKTPTGLSMIRGSADGKQHTLPELTK